MAIPLDRSREHGHGNERVIGDGAVRMGHGDQISKAGRSRLLSLEHQIEELGRDIAMLCDKVDERAKNLEFAFAGNVPDEQIAVEKPLNATQIRIRTKSVANSQDIGVVQEQTDLAHGHVQAFPQRYGGEHVIDPAKVDRIQPLNVAHLDAAQASPEFLAIAIRQKLSAASS